MVEADRLKLFNYIQEYHEKEFLNNYTLDDLIPILPRMFEDISIHLQNYMDKL